MWPFCGMGAACRAVPGESRAARLSRRQDEGRVRTRIAQLDPISLDRRGPSRYGDGCPVPPCAKPVESQDAQRRPPLRPHRLCGGWTCGSGVSSSGRTRRQNDRGAARFPGRLLVPQTYVEPLAQHPARTERTARPLDDRAAPARGLYHDQASRPNVTEKQHRHGPSSGAVSDVDAGRRLRWAGWGGIVCSSPASATPGVHPP